MALLRPVTNDGMSDSILERLPVDLRCMVYNEYLEQQLSLIELDIAGDRSVVTSDISALQNSCRQIRNELKATVKLANAPRPKATVRFDIKAYASKVGRHEPSEEEKWLLNMAMVLFGYRGQICGHKIHAVEFHLGTVDYLQSEAYIHNRTASNLDQAIELIVKATGLVRKQTNTPCKVLCDMLPAPGKSFTVELATQTEAGWRLTPLPKDGACNFAFAQETRALVNAWKAKQKTRKWVNVWKAKLKTRKWVNVWKAKETIADEHGTRTSGMHRLRFKLPKFCVHELKSHQHKSGWYEGDADRWTGRAHERMRELGLLSQGEDGDDDRRDPAGSSMAESLS